MKYLIMSLLALSLSCATVPPTPAPYTCATACARGAELDCDWARWNPDVGNCASQCASEWDYWGYDLKCMTTAVSCEVAEKCQRPNFGAHRLKK